MNSEMGFSSKLRRLTAPVMLRNDPRGARHWGASSRRKLVCGRSVWILTMMQSCASAAKLRGGGPHSLRRHLCHVTCRFPPPRIVNRQSALNRQRERRIGKRCCSQRPSACRTQDDALQCLAGRDKPPERDQQLACQRDNHRLARAGSAVGSTGLVPPGQCALLLKPQKAPGELDQAVDVLWARIRDRLGNLERMSVIERTLVNYQAIDKDGATWRQTAAALLAIYSDKADVLAAANSRAGQRGLAGLASRIVAEMALCTSPIAGVICTNIDLDALIADAAMLLECAGQSDALDYDLTGGDLSVLPNGSFKFDTTFSETLHQPYMDAQGERTFAATAANYGAAFEIASSASDDLDEAFEAFEAVFRAEFGLGLRELSEFAADMTSEALDRESPYFRLPRSELEAGLAKVAKDGPAAAERAATALTLTPRPRWDEPKPVNAKARDWYPWRFNRRLSLTRRPLVQLTLTGDPEVVIFPNLLERTLRYLFEAFQGRLPAELFDSDGIRQWIGAAVDREGHRFDETVTERLELGWEVVVELRVTALGGAPGLGDIDVLLGEPTRPWSTP